MAPGHFAPCHPTLELLLRGSADTCILHSSSCWGCPCMGCSVPGYKLAGWPTLSQRPCVLDAAARVEAAGGGDLPDHAAVHDHGALIPRVTPVAARHWAQGKLTCACVTVLCLCLLATWASLRDQSLALHARYSTFPCLSLTLQLDIRSVSIALGGVICRVSLPAHVKCIKGMACA